MYNKIVERLEKMNTTVDKELIKRAYDFSEKCHEGQFRHSGEPYFTHPCEVALILCDLGMDDQTICAALLHDVIEDTDVSYEELSSSFGEEIAVLVDGVTKLGKIPYSSKEEQQVESLRKMFFAMARDIRVIIIKLADRLHNMRTMKFIPESKRREKALETMEIYAPLAHRLGINSLKWELEDLSLMYLDPIAYKEITESIAQKRAERLKILKEIQDNLEEELKKAGINCSIEGRIKHFYSIYRKLFLKNKTMDAIYDLFAVRVIVDSVKDCYTALGVAHELYNPMPGRFKDYISMPKKNMYQSLHSTMISHSGVPFEIQIRTKEMHKTAEYGIAAHWKYKEGNTQKNDLDSKLSWVRQLLEDEKNATPGEFISNLKIDLFSDEVFVFTPKGDVISLPQGSTPIDFAFAIHSAIGCKMTGAKINGKIMPLDTELQNGDIVDIITSSNTAGPSQDWLKIAKTSQAKNKILSWTKKINREEYLSKGKEIMEKELKKYELSLKDFTEPDFSGFVLKRFSFNRLEDFFVTLGFGRVPLDKVLNRVREYKKKTTESVDIADLIDTDIHKRKADKTGIIVKGIDNCLVKFARCCNPVPGDDVVGYITRGRGVSVHRKDCLSIRNLEKTDGNKERLIEVEWADKEFKEGRYFCELLITCNDRAGLLMDITLCLSELKISIKALNAKTTKDLLSLINVTLEINSAEKLNKAVSKLKTVKDVISVTRTNN